MLFPWQAFSAAHFAVAPGVIEFDLENIQTQTFLVTNDGDQRIRLIVRPVYYAVDSRFLAAGKPIDAAQITDDNLTKFILASPRVFSLKPGQKRNVRVSLKKGAGDAPGDYRAHLLVQTLGSAEGPEEGGGAGQGVQIKLTTSLESALAVYARRGKAKPELAWTCAKNAQGQLVINLKNPTPWRYNGWAGLIDPSGTAKPFFMRLVAQRESVKELILNPPYPQSITLQWGPQQDQLTDGSASCQVP
ncbi:MAG: hypothetical protein RRB13_08800 [bacterium]|nr:hypothetical protein [bacterium]